MKQVISSEAKLIISLERTACYGTCPIYKIEIFTDGTGVYTGIRFVENIGITKFHLPEDKINLILNHADSINFITLQDEYTERISDLPTTFIQIRDKRIRDYNGAPSKLKELELLIDQIYSNTIIK